MAKDEIMFRYRGSRQEFEQSAKALGKYGLEIIYFDAPESEEIKGCIQSEQSLDTIVRQNQNELVRLLLDSRLELFGSKKIYALDRE